MSYYVLTPLSNFNKILAMGSISPAALFQKRRTGFHYFEVAPGEPQTAIRLYKNEPELSSYSEDCPLMIIRVPKDSVPPHAETRDYLWTTRTIQLPPQKPFAFIFENEQTLEEVFNGVKMSIEAKFSDKYRCISTVATQTIPLDFENEFPSEPFPGEMLGEIKDEDVRCFEMVDRFKGALYCYCLDESLSVPKERCEDYAKSMRMVNELINASTQESQVEMFNKVEELERIMFRFSLENKLAQLKEKGANCRFDVGAELSDIRRGSVVELPRAVDEQGLILNDYRDCLEGRLRELVGAQHKSKGRPKVYRTGYMPILNIAKQHGKLAECLINELIAKDVFAQVGKRLGYQFALESGKLLKGCFDGDWQHSPERDYLNALLRHLKGEAAFDANDRHGINNEQNYQLVKSLALLSAREDNRDLDTFYRYMLSRYGVADFRLPFALWGAVFGFSLIPKTLCDDMSDAAYGYVRKLFKEGLGILGLSDGNKTREPYDYQR